MCKRISHTPSCFLWFCDEKESICTQREKMQKYLLKSLTKGKNNGIFLIVS